MYMDSVVLAGVITVLLILGFFVGIGVFIVRDQKLHGENSQKDGKTAGKSS